MQPEDGVMNTLDDQSVYFRDWYSHICFVPPDNFSPAEERLYLMLHWVQADADLDIVISRPKVADQ